MKKLLPALMLLLFCNQMATAQNKEKNQPEEKVTVQREYDQQGNLIRFDSLRVMRWGADSLFQFPWDEGWEDLFPGDFFSGQPGHPFFGDSAFSFSMPGGRFPFSLFNEEELFPGFRNFMGDSTMVRNFIFHNDTSFFMGPDSSFMLPPGFFIPGTQEMEDMRKLLEQHFRSFNPGDYPSFGEDQELYKRFTDPRQQEEWEELLKKQQKEMEEFREKWEKKQQNPGIEKM
jgi:hypothetical protein